VQMHDKDFAHGDLHNHMRIASNPPAVLNQASRVGPPERPAAAKPDNEPSARRASVLSDTARALECSRLKHCF
jgi:hypothetical protein